MTMNMTLPSKLGADSTLPDVGQVLLDALENLQPKLGVGDLATPEHHCEANLVAFLEKPTSVPGLELVVVLLDAGPELDLFDLDVVLLLLGLPGRPGLLVLELPVVHQLDHGRPCVGGHLHQVQPRCLSALSGLVDADDTDLLALIADEANGADPDLVVDSDLLFFDGSDPPCLLSVGLPRGPIPGKKRPGVTGPQNGRGTRGSSSHLQTRRCPPTRQGPKGGGNAGSPASSYVPSKIPDGNRGKPTSGSHRLFHVLTQARPGRRARRQPIVNSASCEPLLPGAR